MNPLITVLMPVHNGATHLAEAIQSILNQTQPDLELLIVDDASTDHSISIIHSFKDSRIHLISSPERLKLSGALNLGLTHAQGRYIARMDADDISLPHRLAIQTQFMEQHPDIGLMGSWIRYFGGNSHAILRRPLTHDDIKAFSLFDTPFAHPTVIFRRDLFTRHALRFDGSYFPTEDYELWTRALQHITTANLPQVLLRYRVHGNSLTGADWSTMDDQAIRVIQTQLASLGLNPTEAELRFHRQLAMGKLNMTRDLLDKAEHWLTCLRAANQSTQAVSPAALASVLHDVWSRACLHSAKLGFWVARRFQQSPHGHFRHSWRRHQWLIRLASLKAKLTA
jgi:glycosyltransferase involved in cell wall biosynthesis